MLYSRRQVEWEPASNLIEGVCLTLQRQPIISFLPHLRSLINVCVNLVSSRGAVLRYLAPFNSAIDFSALKIYRSTTLCPSPWKQVAQVTLKLVRGISRWCVGRRRGPSLPDGILACYFPRATLTFRLLKLRWELRAASWRVGWWRLHDWQEVEKVLGGDLKIQRVLLFMLQCKMTLSFEGLCKEKLFLITDVISRVWSWQGFVQCMETMLEHFIE